MALTKVTNSMIEGAQLYVGDYGALATVGVDDQPAIQAAIDAAHASGIASVQLLANKDYRISKPLYLRAGVSLVSSSPTRNFIISKTTNTVDATLPTVTNTSIVYTLGAIDAVVIVETANSGASASYTNGVGVINGTLQGSGVTIPYAIYAPRVTSSKFIAAVYSVTTGYWTNNTWLTEIDLTGNSTATNLCTFANDGSGDGTGTSCDISLWHKGVGRAFYAYALIYSKIKRVILEGTSFTDDAVTFDYCRGMQVEQIGLEVCTVSTSGKAIFRIAGGDVNIQAGSINNLTLSAGTFYIKASAAQITHDASFVSPVDTAASYCCDIGTSTLKTNTDTTSANTYIRLPGFTKEITGTAIYSTNLGVWVNRFDAVRPYQVDGNRRIFAGVSAAPVSGTWAKGDTFYQTQNIATGQVRGWVQSAAGAPSFVSMGVFA